MITIQHQQEGLSSAYIRACAACAGCNITIAEKDYGVDGCFHAVQIRDRRRLQTGHSIEFQVKASIDWTLKGEAIEYDLEAKTFNDLVERNRDGGTPMVLILLCLPRDQIEWLQVFDDKLVVKNCAYWHVIRDDVPTTNNSSKRILIPVNQKLRPDSVTELLRKVKAGEFK